MGTHNSTVYQHYLAPEELARGSLLPPSDPLQKKSALRAPSARPGTPESHAAVLKTLYVQVGEAG